MSLGNLAASSVVAVGGRKQRTVLAVLGWFAGRRVSTETLISAVWGDDASASASRSISTYVSNLRSILGPVIESAHGGYELVIGRDEIDASVFEDAHAAGDASSARAALGLWRGEPFGDVDGGFVLIEAAAAAATVAATETDASRAQDAKASANTWLRLALARCVGVAEGGQDASARDAESARIAGWMERFSILRRAPYATEIESARRQFRLKR